MPSLIASFCRILLIAIPALMLSRLPGFELRWIWFLSVFAIIVQLTIILLLLRREFRIKLDLPVVASPETQMSRA
jgi:Na+-driven multidrug efflux pump